jgi:hypothetical protein
VLTKVFRQRDTSGYFGFYEAFQTSYRIAEFIDMLSATRSGQLEDWHVQEFFRLSREVKYSDGISPTQLCVSDLPRSV